MKKEKKLIAEFMGWNIQNITTIPTNLHLSNLELDNGDTMELKYHTSWDWLMPVLEKIFSLGYDYTIKPRHIIIKERMGEIVSECIGQEQSQQQITYQAVIEFINEHNKNK